MTIKNKLIGIQVNNKIKEGKIRKELNEQLKMYEMVGEKNSRGGKGSMRKSWKLMTGI